MTLRHRARLVVLFGAAAAILLGSRRGGSYAATWASGNQELQLSYSSMPLYKVPLALIVGPGEITGTYQIRNGSESAIESGKFKMLRDSDGYVTAYELAGSDGHARQWISGYCEMLKDETGNGWQPISGSAPIRVSEGLMF